MKHTILKLFSLDTLLTFILRLFHGITTEQFQQALAKALEAEQKFKAPGSGESKRKHVIDYLKNNWKDLSFKALNILVELAVSYLMQKGKLK